LRLPRLSVLFDRTQIDAKIHLNYLWLVLGNEALPQPGLRPLRVHRESIGFNAHLQSWRKLAAGTQRAEFYMLMNVRDRGAPWLNELKNKPVDDLATFFEAVPAHQFRDLMRTSRNGAQRFYAEDLLLLPSPLKPEQEASFAYCYDDMLAELASFNRTLVNEGVHFVSNWSIYFDMSSTAALEAIRDGDAIQFEFSCDVRSMKANLNIIDSSQPWFTSTPLEVNTGDRTATVHLSEATLSRPYLRRQIQLQIATACPGTIQHLRIRKNTSPDQAHLGLAAALP